MGDFLIYAFHACNSLSAHILTVLGQVQIVNLFLIFFFLRFSFSVVFRVEHFFLISQAKK